MTLEGLYDDMKDVWAQTVCMWMSDAKLEGERIEAWGRGAAPESEIRPTISS